MRRGTLFAAGVMLAALAWGCGDGTSSEPQQPAATAVVGEITVELSGDPSVSYSAGRTTVVVQFVARGSDGVPLSASDVAVEMRVDDQPVDNESILQESSQELGSSLLYALVLDASGSMIQHTPPAFAPMKQAARDSVQQGLNLWENRPGTFAWDLCWFNDFLFHRLEPWTPAIIQEIPEPPTSAATKLYSAVEFMAEELHDAYAAGVAAGPRDNHVMVVFSDGADNYSFYDNRTDPKPPEQPLTGALYETLGWKPTNLADAIAAIQAHPKLTVHVLAMGSILKSEDLTNLKTLATAGKGQFLRNPSSEGTKELFERVTKEFSTLQTRGASIPQDPREYDFTVVVRSKTSPSTGSYTFRYRAGPAAQVL